MGVERLFDGLVLEIGDVIPCTVGKGMNQAKYIADVMNELEGMGFVAGYREDGRDIK